MLVGLGNVRGNPAPPVDVKLSPAVVPADGSVAALGGQWKTNFKTGREIVGAGEGNEQAVEIGAVAESTVTGPQHVSVSITRLRLVVSHVCVDPLVQRAGQFQRFVPGKRLGVEQGQWLAIDRYLEIGGEKQFTLGLVELGPGIAVLQATHFVARDVPGDPERERVGCGRLVLEIQHLVAVFRLGCLPWFDRPVHAQACGCLGPGGLRHREPDSQSSLTGNFLDRHAIVQFK